MQKLYGCVPLLNAVGSLMFLLIISLRPSAITSLGVDFDWRSANVVMVSLMLVVIAATAFAKQWRTKRLGLMINATLIVGMTIILVLGQVPELISEYLWLWALIMVFNLALIGWGWLKLRKPKSVG